MKKNINQILGINFTVVFFKKTNQDAKCIFNEIHFKISPERCNWAGLSWALMRKIYFPLTQLCVLPPIFIVNMKQVLVIKCCYSNNLICSCWKFEPHHKLPSALLPWKVEDKCSLKTFNFEINAVFHKKK